MEQNLTVSPPYWMDITKNENAIIEQKGIPTLFLLSADTH